VNPFFEGVFDILRQVPYGKVVSYGQIARLLGNPRAAREVGWAMHVCPEGLPWHRVVLKDGGLTGGEEYKPFRRKLLEEEGVEFGANDKVDMQRFGWLPN
jgi:methylated-DNA-protein-cysteine methyltransferase-like protein